MKCLSFLLAISAFSITDFAQKIYKHNSQGVDCYSEIHVYDPSGYNAIGTLVMTVENQQLLLESHQNEVLQSGLFNQYRFVFVQLLHCGSTSESACLASIIASFSDAKGWAKEAVFYLKKADTTMLVSLPNSINRFTSIEVKSDGSEDLNHLLNELRKKDPAELPQESKQYPNNIAVGGFLGINKFGNDNLGLDKSVIASYGLSFNKRLFNNFSVKSSIGFSIDKPSKKSLKSEAKSQVMTSIENGDSIASILIDVNGHALLYGDLFLTYSFNTTKSFRPYLSLGVGGALLKRYNVFYQDSIDVSGGVSSLLNGSVNFKSATSAAITKISDWYFLIGCEPGMELQINRNWILYAAIPVKWYYQSNQSAFTWGVSIGLAFSFEYGFPNKR